MAALIVFFSMHNVLTFQIIIMLDDSLWNHSFPVPVLNLHIIHFNRMQNDMKVAKELRRKSVFALFMLE